jgi:CO/xanthine dehydrogenase FAD-binding subunit
MEPDELLRAIRLPRRAKAWRQYYRKVGTRKAQAISKVCFAGAALVEGGEIRDIRIALGSVAPTVLRAVNTENGLRGAKLAPAIIQAAKDLLARDIAPIDDIRSTARYRLRVAQNLLEEFLLQLTK